MTSTPGHGDEASVAVEDAVLAQLEWLTDTVTALTTTAWTTGEPGATPPPGSGERAPWWYLDADRHGHALKRLTIWVTCPRFPGHLIWRDDRVGRGVWDACTEAAGVPASGGRARAVA